MHSVLESGVVSIRALTVVTVAAMFYAYAMVVQVMPLAFITPLVHELQLSGTDLGLLSSSFYWSYAPMQLVVGCLVARLGARRVLNFAIPVCCLGGVLFATSSSRLMLQIARILMGGSTACAFVSTLGLVVNWLPVHYYALVSGAVGTLGALGGAVGSEPVALMLRYGSWRQVAGAIALVGGGLWLLNFLLVRDAPAEPMTDVGRCDRTAKYKYQGKATCHDCCRVVWERVASLRRIVLATVRMVGLDGWLVVGYSLLVWAPMLTFVVLWSAPFLQVKMQMDSVAAGRMVVWCWLGLAFFSPLLGWYSERCGDRLKLMVACAVIGAIALGTLLWLPCVVGLVAVVMLLIGLASAGQSLSFMWVRDRYAAGSVSVVNGIVNFAIVLGGAIMPSLVGVILDHRLGILGGGMIAGHYGLQDYQVALVVAPVCYLGAATLSWLVRWRSRRLSMES